MEGCAFNLLFCWEQRERITQMQRHYADVYSVLRNVLLTP